MMVWLAGQEQTQEGRAVYQAAGIPVFSSVGDMARVAGLVAPPKRPSAPITALPRPAAPSMDRIRELLDAPDGPALLDAIAVAQPASAVARTREEAATAVAGLGGPAAMKLLAGALAHKSDVGGVRLDVNAAHAAEAFDELIESGQAHHVDAVEGVLVQEMVLNGTELIIAATGSRNGFPPLVTVGFGGITTEIYADVASGLTPVSPEEAWAMLRGLRAWPLLAGFRGAPARDVQAVVDTVIRVGHLAAAAGPRRGRGSRSSRSTRSSSGCPARERPRSTCSSGSPGTASPWASKRRSTGRTLGWDWFTWSGRTRPPL